MMDDTLSELKRVKYWSVVVLVGFVLGVLMGYSIGRNYTFASLSNQLLHVQKGLDEHRGMVGHPPTRERMLALEKRVDRLEAGPK